jgi:hypothetical protein
MLRKSIISNISKCAYSSSRNVSAEASAVSSNQQMILNFCSPDTTIFTKKAVSSVILPGEAGEYGVTLGHSPIIAQLKPGVVTVLPLSVS